MVDVDRGAAIEMIRKSGQQGVPVTVIGDQVVVGFDRARLERILGDLKRGGASTSAPGRPSLGAKVADAGNYELPGGRHIEGALVGGVNLGSPAEVAGIRAGDVIIGVGNTSVRSASSLSAALASNPGNRLRLKIDRGGQVQDVEVLLGQPS